LGRTANPNNGIISPSFATKTVRKIINGHVGSYGISNQNLFWRGLIVMRHFVIHLSPKRWVQNLRSNIPKRKKRPKNGSKIFVFKRNWLTAIACCAAACVMFAIVNHPAIVGASATTRQLPIYSVEREYKVCSLSFDAAWGNEDTQQLIDILGKHHIKATFFVVGAWVDKYPESVKALSDAGHEVMNHSDTHAHMTKLSKEEIISDIQSCNAKVAAVTGVTPTLIRPPYGEYDDNVITAIRSIGMEPVQWDVDSLDWKDLSASEITKRVTEHVGPGSIVLFHNAALHTPAALDGIIQILIQKGYSFLPISELIFDAPYTIDHTGRQFSAATTSPAASPNVAVPPSPKA
jgi:polysaccharide deacetylase family sporulation protein PdaB